jgi:hypothetical protein
MVSYSLCCYGNGISTLSGAFYHYIEAEFNLCNIEKSHNGDKGHSPVFLNPPITHNML